MEHQAVAQPLFEQAKPHADAANAAIDEHNKAASRVQGQSRKRTAEAGGRCSNRAPVTWRSAVRSHSGGIRYCVFGT